MMPRVIFFEQMKNLFYKLIAATIALFAAFPAFSCTSVIISGKVTASGKPVMMKHRDAGELNNRIEWFRGPVYSFIGLVNSPSEGGEVWTGTNSAGFSIMNTASYNIKDDDVPSDEMDKEGIVMFKALGSCASTEDFERLLDTMERPMGVEANFGVIDAKGGAAYYEVNNHSWVKYDVSADPKGWRVVTNFSESGRYEDYMGYERYLTASAIMNELDSEALNGKIDVDHNVLFWNFSRSYRHEMLGFDYLKDFNSLSRNNGFKGVVVDQDFIPRRSTAASIVIEGVKAGEDPLHTIMWTILGYPACSVAMPLMVNDSDTVPSFMKKTSSSMNSPMCDMVLDIKSNNVFRYRISNGKNYLDLTKVVELLHSCSEVESYINSSWNGLFSEWTKGSLSYEKFKSQYNEKLEEYFSLYKSKFSSFVQ